MQLRGEGALADVPGHGPPAPGPAPPPKGAPAEPAIPPQPPLGGEVAAAALGAPGGPPERLRELELTPAQIDAVLALSREIIERVVWEVVPTLAETMIQEELTRPTQQD